MSGAIQKAASNAATAKKQPTMQQYIKSMQSEIQKALPSVMTPERFTRIVLSALSGSPKLQQCDPQSFLAAMMTAAQLGVEPNTPLGQAYLIPYAGKCQFQLGYKGMLDLAYRSGEVSVIQAHVVRENDDFTYSLGLEPQLKHVPATQNRGNATHVYAMYRTKDGGYGFEVMSMEEARAHGKKYAKSYNNSPWQTDFEEMAKKTVLKKALKYAPMKSDFVRGLASDETVKHDISDDMSTVQPDFVEADFEETGEVDFTDTPFAATEQ